MASGAKIPPFTVAVDSREQHGYHFENSVVCTLETGDYGIIEAQKAITIERKNPADAVVSIINNRDRFIAEMERMQEYSYRAIVIEETMEGMLRPYGRSKANPRAVIQSYLAFSVRYNVCVFFVGNRTLGKTTTLRLLEWAWHKRCSEIGII